MNIPVITQFISKIKYYIKPDSKVLLGRWSLNNCNKSRNIKIDLSNEDHCGTCSQYRLKQIIRFKVIENRQKY